MKDSKLIRSKSQAEGSKNRANLKVFRIDPQSEATPALELIIYIYIYIYIIYIICICVYIYIYIYSPTPRLIRRARVLNK